MAHKLEPEPYDRRESIREIREGHPDEPHGERHVHEEPHVVESHEPGYEYLERVSEDVGLEQRQHTEKVAQLAWLLFGIIEALLAMRVILKLVGANPMNAFTSSIYDITEIFVMPFYGLTGNPAYNRVIFEVTTLIAMLVYLFIAWVVVRVIWLLYERPSARSTSIRHRERM